MAFIPFGLGYCGLRWARFVQHDHGHDTIEIYKQEKEAREKMSKKDIADNIERGAKMIEETNAKAKHFTNDWYTLNLPSVSFADKIGFRIMRPYNNEGDLPLAGLFNSTMEIIENAIKSNGLSDAAEIEEVPGDSSCWSCGLGALVIDVMYTKINGEKLLEFMALRHELSTMDWGPIAALVSRVLYRQD